MAPIMRRLWGSKALPLLVILITSVAMTPSIRRGVEFGDEGYYLQLLLNLEEKGFAESQFRTPHQLAALVQLPLLATFRYFNNNIDGLALFLRTSYQVLSLISAVLLFLTLAKTFSRTSALVGSLSICTFIPSYLPTLSYNTLVMIAFTVAFTSQLLSLESDRRWARSILALISCIAWIVGCLAYPTFVVVAAMNVLILLTRAGDNPRAKPIALLLLTASALTALLLLGNIDFSWFVEAFRYQRAVSAGYRNLGDTGIQLDVLRPSVITSIGLLVISGLSSKPLIRTLSIVVAILTILTSSASPQLPRTHFVIAIVGLGFAIQSVLKKRISLISPTCIEYVVPLSLTFCLVLASSSGATSMNLALATIVPAGIQLATWLNHAHQIEEVGLHLSAICLILLIVHWSYTNHYGDSVKDPVIVETGVYKGLTTSRENALLLKDYQNFLQRKGLSGSTVAYVGVNSGLLIDANLKLLQISPWPIDRKALEHAKMATRYMDELNPKPGAVLIDSHWYINPFGYQFFCLYQLEESQQLSNGNALEIWTFNDSLSVCPS